MQNFTTFSAIGVGFLSHTLENNVQVIWLIWNLVQVIYFQRYDIVKFVFSRGNNSLSSDVYPGIRIEWCQITFIIKNDFSDLKLHSLRISAIFNKNNNFLVSNFSRPLAWKMNAAAPWPVDSFELWKKGKNKKS